MVNGEGREAVFWKLFTLGVVEIIATVYIIIQESYLSVTKQQHLTNKQRCLLLVFKRIAFTGVF